MTDNNYLPPQNIDAEESILGGILLDPDALGRILDLIVPEAFYVQAHRDIYQGAIELNKKGQPTDLMTVTTWLADRNLLEKIGGTATLVRLASRTVSAVNIDRYAELVMDKYQRRQLISAGHEIIELGHDTASELETVLDRSEQKIFGLTQNRPQQGLVALNKTLNQTLSNIEKLHQNAELPGIDCDFYDLDAMTGGFGRSDLVIVAGRPSMGKCLAANSEIVLADGSIATIEEIYRRQEAILLTLQKDFQFSFTRASAFIDDGIKPVFRVTTALGKAIETTITHPFLTPQGWRSLGELQPGFKIAIPAQINIFGTENVPESELELLVDRLTSSSNKNEEKSIPSFVFKLSKDLIAYFLNSFFENINPVKATAENLEYTLFSYGLAGQLQHLLLRFGIISTLAKIAIDSENEFYRLKINNEQFLETIQKQKQKSSLAVLNKKQIYWDEIIAIESVGKKQVYDLTIPKTHNFVANDICVHNTSFALNVASNIAQKHRLPVAVFSLEMSKEQLAQRMLSSESRIESNRLRSGRLSQNEFEPLTVAMANLSQLPIFIDDTANLTVMQMRAQLRRLKAEAKNELGLVLLDYLQLMEGSGSENRVQELSRITRSLKGLARELNVPVIALSQLSRGVEQRTNKRPMLSDLRESGAIEQDADLVLMLYRDEYYQPDSVDRGVAEIIIAKHRNGPTGTVKMLFQAELTKFLNLQRGQDY